MGKTMENETAIYIAKNEYHIHERMWGYDSIKYSFATEKEYNEAIADEDEGYYEDDCGFGRNSVIKLTDSDSELVSEIARLKKELESKFTELKAQMGFEDVNNKYDIPEECW